jgi:hypothetical protein
LRGHTLGLYRRQTTPRRLGASAHRPRRCLPTEKGNTVFSSTLKRSVATLGVVAGLLAAAVSASAAGPAVTNSGQANGAYATGTATAQGIIMRDGGVCDPIRHMGC